MKQARANQKPTRGVIMCPKTQYAVWSLRREVYILPLSESTLLHLIAASPHLVAQFVGTAASFYDAFPPEEAQRIWQKLEVHYTPKHGSWLNIAEIEISIFERVCLSKRVTSCDELWQHIVALASERNEQRCRIHWRFS